MRRWLVATVLAYSTVGFCASESVSDAPSIVDMSEAAQGVAISAIPTPPRAIEVLTLEESDRMRAARKARIAAKKKASTVLMLSRTERRQVAILAANTQSSEPQSHVYDQDDNSQGNIDDLDLHRSFNRPRVVDEPDGDKAEADDLPGHVRVRLMMARLKAVEAHALNQVTDDGEALPDSVMARLKEARLKAVEAHQRKFG
ncbi:MAG: hypothetical protein H6R14_1232 [Proteobacteria bacterium]|nr:hypothetical protein [Pseudomonadota bacterium]